MRLRTVRVRSMNCSRCSLSLARGTQKNRSRAEIAEIAEVSRVSDSRFAAARSARSVFSALSATVVLLAATSLHAAPARAPLADAAEKMDRAQVRALIRQHVGINVSQPDGMTPLHWATYHDDLDIAQILVRAGANVKAANRYGVTP